MLSADMTAIAIFSISILFILIAYLFTRKSAMSWGWGIFFSFSLSPIIAIIFTYLIGRYGSSKKKSIYTHVQIRNCAICAILALFLFQRAHQYWPQEPLLLYYPNMHYDNDSLEYYNSELNKCIVFIASGIGFLGAVLYLILDVDTYIYEDISCMYKNNEEKGKIN